MPKAPKVERIHEIVRVAERALAVRRREVAKETRAVVAALGARPARFHEAGVRLAAIAEARTFTAAGYGSFAAYLEGALSLGRTQGWKLVRVAEALPEAAAMALGVERCCALLDYAKAATAKPAKLAAKDAVIGDRRLSECSVRDLRAATRALAEPGAEALGVDGVAAWLRRAGVEGATVTAHDGGVRIDLPATTALHLTRIVLDRSAG